MAKPAAPAKRPKPLSVTAYALVHHKGGVAPLRFELDVARDLTDVEVLRVELGEEDYRAITEKKVAHALSSHTPEWSGEE